MQTRFGIVLTYDCNLRCQGCNRFLDVMRVPNSDIDEETLREGHERVKAAGIEVRKARVTGGEPLLHPKFGRLMKVIKETWNKGYGGRTCVFSNGTQDRPFESQRKKRSWRYRVSSVEDKRGKFFPPMLSPHDLGLEPVLGGEVRCKMQAGCGRLFDVFGFSFCILAGPLGKMFDVDPYSAHPLMHGWTELCRHCPFSQRKEVRNKLFEQAENGTLEGGYPTKSYKEAVMRGDFLLDIPKFGERK